MFAEFNNIVKEVCNNMYDQGMKNVALMEDSQKQFIALSYKSVAGVEGWNSFVQPMQEVQTQMLDMSYSAMRTASSQMKAMTDEAVSNFENTVVSAMPKAN
ncbi:MAG: hypothetical protein P8O70_15990 [SAR324 cluster bacterium]|nr:hypothetical protein [SAR324 cluster bacterium]